MRVVHICQRDNPDIGGSLRVAEALVREQRKCGVDAWILFLYGPPADVSRELSPNLVCLELYSSREVLKGIFTLKRAIRQIDPDVIHMHDGLVWPRLVLMQLGVPVVMHTHLPADNHNKLALGFINRTTDLLIGISDYTIKSWAQAGYPRSKICPIQNGVDLDRFTRPDPQSKLSRRKALGLPENKKVLLWLGRLHREMKGVDRIERISRMLPEDTVLVVVGNGPEYQSMLESNADLLHAGKLVMTGSSAMPQIYYQAADAFLFTSHYEPFGLVILEAAASGLPILAFPVDKGGGASALLKELSAQYIEDNASVEEVQNAIHRVFSNQIAANGARETVARKYSWKMKSSQVMEGYRTMLRLTAGPCGNEPKVLVCQHGARHRYAIPRMLNEAGLLSAFYTDSSEESHVGKIVKFIGAFAPYHWRKIARWNILGVPREKIYSSDSPYFIELLQKPFRVPKEGIELYHQRHKILSDIMKKWGLQDANIIYSMYHEGLDFIQWAKDRGAGSVVDVFISPITAQIMEDEALEFPDWVDASDEGSLKFERTLWEMTVSLADLLICPSEWVAEGVRSISPDAGGKIRIVPYGCSIDYGGKVNKPVKGRILFAGNDPLRKGLHYLGQAVTQLKSSLPGLDARVAGNLPEHVTSDRLCQDLNFLGHLDGQKMKEEFLSADVFVLPALSEGFAGVVAEALGAGCPVIVTKEAGSPVVHGREGLVVPVRGIEPLAQAIRKMVEDRDFRNLCAKQCLEQVEFYTEKNWQNRLIKEITDYFRE